MVIVIGISGVTCGGKTLTANQIKEQMKEKVILIHQDDYYYPMDSGKLEYLQEYQHYNWDVITSIDMEKLINDVKQAIVENANNNCEAIMVEGNLIFNNETLAKLCTFKYYVTVPKDIAKMRRATRKYKRYHEGYFESHVWPLTIMYKSEITNKYNLRTLDGTSNVNVNVQIILSDLQLLKK